MSALKMPVWKQAPFLQFLFPLVLGIALGWYYPFPGLFYPLWAIAFFVGLLLLFHLIFNGIGGRLKRYAGTEVFCGLLLFGCFLSWWNNTSLRSDFAGRFLTDSSFVEVKLEEPPLQKANSWKAEVSVMAIENGNQFHKVRGHSILYFQKESSSFSLRYGDVLLIPNHLQPLRNSGNPGAFNFRRYYHLKNIYFTGYLKQDQWQTVAHNQGNRLKVFFLRCRTACVRVLEKYITRPREAGVAEALLLGYRGNLDPGLKQAYANVGVVHIIAISGLHVGLIFLLLTLLLRFLPDRKNLKRLKGGIILLALWSFALLTGAHPSTLRATIMLSFIIAGQAFFRRTVNPYNSLAASAFLLLCFNPFLLFDVGFQLSYLAVSGIVIFQHPLNSLFFFKSRFANYIWELLSVCLAAQLLIFPLLLYYFHQFPNLFLLSNLVLVPLASLILYGEVGLMIISFLPVMAKGLGWLLTKVMTDMDQIILWANGLSFIRWSHVQVSVWKLLPLYGIIIALSIWLFYKNKKSFVWAIGLSAVCVLLGLWRQRETRMQKKMIVYQISHHSALEFVNGRHSQLVCDSALRTDKEAEKYTLYPAKQYLRVKKRTFLSGEQHFFSFFSQKIVFLQQPFYRDTIIGSLPVNEVIVSKHNRLSMAAIKRHFLPKVVVFDASISHWKIEKWKTACKKLNLHYFSVPDQGAWILSLK